VVFCVRAEDPTAFSPMTSPVLALKRVLVPLLILAMALQYRPEAAGPRGPAHVLR
jgi:hypothetical protein